MNSIRNKLSDRFYRGYLIYTALETELLFYVVCDVMFLTKVKGFTMEQVSQITFFLLAFSLVILYPLLKFINHAGNRIAVRTGSVIFMLSAVCITFAPGFYTVLAGAFLKCAGHTLNAMGTAVMKNHLARNDFEDQFVSFQSDANSATAAVMMITSFLCGILFVKNAYYPMAACILLSFAGVIVSFQLSRNEQSSDEIIPASSIKQYSDERKQIRTSYSFLIFASFAIFTGLAGTGLSYARMNFQELLSMQGSGYTITLLSIASTLVFLFRFLSNVILGSAYNLVRERAIIIVSMLMLAGLMLQMLPWVIQAVNIAAVLLVGYLMQAFVRDPFTTLIQNITLDADDKCRQQSMLVALNGAKKGGSLLLAAACTLIIRYGSIPYAMAMMTAMAFINIFLCFVIARNKQ